MTHDPRAVKWADTHPGLAIVLGVTISLVPWLLIALALYLVWLGVGAALSVTIGQVVSWFVIFAAGYIFGRSRY